ncbi:MAG: adenylate/guanylate cyclase domain-containing protein [Caldilineales bacterium]|nr:adenylate/guanylate cyclase domain-containing protein [Caldilineales bacterium]
MPQKSLNEAEIEELWRQYLMGGETAVRQRHIFRILPGSPRCLSCFAPFGGAGGMVTRLIYGKIPSNLNPHLCNICEQFAREYQGGAEIELALLFADVRGSTTLAESMAPVEYSKLINRFYDTATEIMVKSDALIDKIIGDQVAGMYVPGFVGPDYTLRAIDAAKALLRATGHGAQSLPWIPIGIGVHTGRAFVGSVGSQSGAVDITVLGDVPNTAARLSSAAAVGEILVSETAAMMAKLRIDDLERRELMLKGKSEAVAVYVVNSADTLEYA